MAVRREKEGITNNAAWSVQFQIYYLFPICGKRNDDDDGDDDGNDKEQKNTSNRQNNCILTFG